MSHNQEAGAPWKRRCVVTCLRQEFARSWIRAYYSTGNTTPLVVVSGLNEWDDDTRKYLESATREFGGMVLDCSDACQRSRRLAARACSHNKGWYTKKLILHEVALRLAPRSWAWIDDDAEVTGEISECFARAEQAPGFIYTQFYFPNEGDARRPLKFYRSKIDKDDKIAWGSFMFFHGEANERLLDLNRDFPVEDDEIVFTTLYKTNPAWRNGFCDFSIHRWQCICKTIDSIPRSWSGKIIHYASNRNGNAVKRMWARKADSLPPAQFEDWGRPEVGVATADSRDPVDAVFVIGTGSCNGNEELRYALRNLEAHCKFVRDVYICGECPPWVNRSSLRHIQWPDRFRHAKDANIIDKLLRACEEPGIAKNILFCSDDQFQTRECTWDSFKPRYLKRYRPGDRWYESLHRVWHVRLKATMERDRIRRINAGMNPDNVFYYQPHMWMQIDRDKFMEYARWSDYQHSKDTIIASGYFNFIDAGGVRNFDHSFLRKGGVVDLSTTHVGYVDSSYEEAMSYLRVKFPNKSRFEI